MQSSTQSTRQPMRRNRVVWMFVSVLVVLSAVVPTSVLVLPYVYRTLMISRLTSADPAKREEALNFVIQRAGREPRMLQGAIAKLAEADRDNFIQIVMALDRAGMWGRPPAPDDAWLRWLEVLAQDEHPEVRILAAQFLADAPDLAAEPRVGQTLDKLAGDDAADVRYNAMTAAAELWGAASLDQRRPFESIIARLSGDTEPETARHAWLLLGLMDPLSGVVAHWRDQPTAVSQAILWAALRSNPDLPAPAIEALADESLAMPVRQMAAYALAVSPKREAHDALTSLLEMGPAAVNESNQVLLWRAILSVGIDSENRPPDKAALAVGAFADAGAQPSDLLKPLALAAVYRAGAAEQSPSADDEWNSLRELAVYEGTATGTASVELHADTPDLVRLAAVAVASQPQPSDLKPLFSAEVSTLRDLACVVAADRFTTEQNTALAGELLKDFNDHAKMSGAILAGLTDVRPQGTVRNPFDASAPARTVDLLAYQAEHASTWAVQQVAQLGLWMQGRDAPHGADMHTVAAGLLTRDDVPRTTILLAMLHRHDRRALDFLLNPRGEPTVNLPELFDQLRWWRVLKRYLPEDAPPFWVWADPQLEQFQIDVLRDWYLLNRRRKGD